MRLPLQQRLVWATGLAAAALIGAAYLFYIHLHRDAQLQTASTIETVLTTTHQALRSWSDAQKSAVRLAASTPGLARLVEDLLQVEPSAEHLRESDLHTQLRQALRGYLTMFNYEGFFIIGPGNLNLSSMREKSIGQENLLVAQPHLLAQLWDGQTVLTLPQTSDVRTREEDANDVSTMFVGTPVRNTAGKPIALLVFRINPHQDFTHLLLRGRLRSTGETYAVDRNGTLISESRFESRLRALGKIADHENAMLNVAITATARPDGDFTRAAASLLRGENGRDLGGYTNYLGVPVVGAWLWDNDLGIGLLSEMERAEAYATVRENILILGLLTALMIIMVAGFNIAYHYNRRKVIASREQLRQVMDLVPHMILAKNWHGKVILANKAAADLFGTDPRSLCLGAQTSAHWVDATGGGSLDDDRHIMTTGERQVVAEESFVDANGAAHIMRSVKIPFASTDRSDPAVLYFSSDITEQKDTERILRRYQNKLEQLVDDRTRELEENSRELRDLYEFAPVGYLSIELREGTITRYNGTLRDLLGVSATEWIGHTVYDLFADTKESRPVANRILMTIRAGETIDGVEAQMKRRDGTVFWVNLRATPKCDANSQPVEIRATVTNINEKKSFDEALRESEERFRSAFETASHGIALVSPAGRWLKVNKALCQIVGYSQAELLATDFQAITHPDDLECELENIKKLLEGRPSTYQMEKRYFHKNGNIVWVSLSVSLVSDSLGRPIHLVSQIQDITQTKLATQAQNRLLAVMDASPDIIAMADQDGRVTYLNRAGRLTIGLGDGDISQLLITDFHPNTVADFIRDNAIPTAIAASYCVFESSFLTLDGREIPTSQVLVVHKDADGQVEYFSTIARDISESKQAEAALAEAEERRRLILDSAGEGIFGINLDGRTTFINPAAAEMLGYTVNELVGRTIHPLIQHHRADGTPYPFHQTPIHTAMTEGTVQHMADEEVLWRKDGSAFPVEYVATPIRKRNSVIGAVVSFSDITHRKEVDKMKSEFVSLVSHELRTPLTSIRGSLGLLLAMNNAQLPSQTQELLRIAHRNSERLLLLINDLLDMEKIASGKMSFIMQPQLVAPLVEQAMVNNRAYADQYGVTYRLVRTANDACVNVDGDRLMQVLNNLLSNAAKFSPRSDQVEIAVDYQGGKIRVSVSDHGPGIPEEFRGRIFQKFSQADSSDTRQKGGTGLGLAISKSIIEKMGGEIGFDSVAGTGTTFYFLLPEPVMSNESRMDNSVLEAVAED